MSENLKNTWKNSIADLPEDLCEKWWRYIFEKYNDKGRYAHNFDYLIERFEELNNFRQYIKNINSFTIAVFFQYLEYNPKDVDCPLKNLEVFNKFADEAKMTSKNALFDEVRALIEAWAVHSTEEHKTEGAYGTSDLHYFLDLDMYILGSSPEKYSKYVSDVHREYSFLSQNEYKSLRAKVLQSFLLIPNIFATKEFRDKFEAQARKNIQEELASLKS